MADDYLALFPSNNIGFSQIYLPSTSTLEADLQLASELLQTFTNRTSLKSKKTATQELFDILAWYANRTGLLQPHPTPFLFSTPFSLYHPMQKLVLPSSPREYSRWMPGVVKLVLGNLPEQKQDSPQLWIINTIQHNSLSTNYRIFQHGCNSQQVK